MLMTHYREPIDFSIKRLEEAERLIAKWPVAEEGAGDGVVDPAVLAALFDDLNTVAAVQALHALAARAASDSQALASFQATAALLGIKREKADVPKTCRPRLNRLSNSVSPS